MLAGVVVAGVLIAGSACSRAEAGPYTSVQSAHVFARLYGYLRYFHPSDEAASIDWDRYAVLGMRRVEGATDAADLASRLERLVAPIAPTVRIYREGERSPGPHPSLTPREDAEPDVVAWQHKGVGTGGTRTPYMSVRVGRPNPLFDSTTPASLTQTVDAGPYRGRTIRLRGHARTGPLGARGSAHLWLRVDVEEGTPFFDSMTDRPIRRPEWTEGEIIAEVSESALRIAFGLFFLGTGRGDFDDLSLEVRQGAGWEEIPIQNASFEEGNAEAPTQGWSTRLPAHELRAAGGRAGGRGISLEAVPTEGPPRVFDALPALGEIADVSIGGGLRASIPLALTSVGGATSPVADPDALERLGTELRDAALGELDAASVHVRRAGVAIAWNVFQHFYPYFDVVETDWDDVLDVALARAEADGGEAAFLETLQWLVAQLDDGHGRVSHALQFRGGMFPARVEWIEGRAVVVATRDGGFEVGDAVLAVDGIPTEQLVREAEELISGSPQWKRARAMQEFGWGLAGSDVVVSVERRGVRTDVPTTRVQVRGGLSEPRPSDIAELEPGIFYVNLDRVPIADFLARTDELADADGVVFDLRGYPNGNHDALTYLTDGPLESAHWQIPQIVYPDQERLVGYDTSGRWNLPPSEPRFTGEIVFLTDGRAISYAESVMGIVEHYRLGHIVGQPTAGTNGNVNPFTLPGGYTISWTGMRVIKHDQSQHHLVGIRPTVPVERTIAAVRAGRDEYLERAVRLIRGG